MKRQAHFWFTGFCIFLVSCSSVLPEVVLPKISDVSHLVILDITADTTRENLEAMYGGLAIVFHPEDSFAIIGFAGEPTSQQLERIRSNRLYRTVYGEGRYAWAGGRNAWAGGWNAWAGGSQTYSTFSENAAHWSNIRLTEGQKLAPRLGAGVVVAVIDTGVDVEHPGLKEFLTPAGTWKDFVDEDSWPKEAPGDFWGHGTAVAGIVHQIAPKARILPIRVLNGQGQGSLVNVIRGIDHAISMGADIINLSLGADGTTDELEYMIRYAEKKNIPLVASAGNNNNTLITHPANWDQFRDYIDAQGQLKTTLVTNRREATSVTAVTSVDQSSLKSSFANYGAVHIAAPGEGILTLMPDHQVASVSGTSFAAPIISGAYALARAEYADLPLSAYAATLIVTSSTPWSKDDPDYESYYKWLGGVVDIESFLRNIPLAGLILNYLEHSSLILNLNLDVRTCNQEGLISSQPSTQTTHVMLSNFSSSSHKIYRLDERGQRELVDAVASQRIWRSVSYEGEAWLIAKENDTCIGIVTEPEELSFMVIGNLSFF